MGEHEQVLLDGQRDVEVVELRHDAALGARDASTRPAARKPSTSISPSSAIACAVSMRIVVDLPAPLGPSRPTHVPVGHVEVEAVDGGDRAEAFDDAAQADGEIGHVHDSFTGRPRRNGW